MNDPKLLDKDPRGRRPALDRDKRHRLLALLSLGCSRRVAARYVGCSSATITNTAARDPAFAEQLAHAEANLDLELLDAVRQAAKIHRHWRAAAWLLERRNPRDYTLQPPDLYSTEQLIQIVASLLDSLRDELDPPQRDRALQKLQTLLLEFNPTVKGRP